MSEKRKFAGKPYIAPEKANLVSSWRRIVTNNGKEPLNAGLTALNNECGKRYTHSRISAWERGVDGRKPDTNVTMYMLKMVLPVVLNENGLNQKAVEGITEQLMLSNTIEDIKK